MSLSADRAQAGRVAGEYGKRALFRSDERALRELRQRRHTVASAALHTWMVID